MSTTFVSIIFDSNIAKNEHLLSQWIATKVYLKLYIQDQTVLHHLQSYLDENNISTIQIVSWNLNMDWASGVEFDKCILPTKRNLEKDTFENIWNTLLKIPCLSDCVLTNPFSTDYFAYMDFHAFELFRDRRTISYIQEQYGNTVSKGRKQIFLQNRHELYIPGCWGNLTKETVRGGEFKHNIHWRFCGAFLFGSKKSVLLFDRYYKMHFETFVKQHDYCLSWEVNYWAWLETMFSEEWKLSWYKGDHNDTLVRVPHVFGFHILQQSAVKYARYKYIYPDVSPYRPMSASIVRYQNQYILNTRYVNYWIYDNGSYWYPEDEHKIRTKNVCSLLKNGSEFHDVLFPTCYSEATERFKPPIVKRAGGFSEGVEDIRLYISNETGKLMFIGSTLGYSTTDKIRIIIGEYHVEICETETGTGIQEVFMNNAKIITSPYDSWCEKNWCPIPLNDGCDGFIYKWNPLEIGKVVDGPCDTYRFEIEHRIPTNTEMFGNVKGSSPFSRLNETQLIGMVHYSEEKSPRQYYNRIVVLDKEKYHVVKCTEAFCFEQIGIEFCMGMEMLGEKYVFWISQKDRDPLMIEVETEFFGDKWIEF